jgi:broad specificity phosphatase PhoE
LSPVGVTQAEALTAQLAGQAFDLVLVSPLLRARQTAEIALPGASIIIDDRLRELVVPEERFFDLSALGPEGLKGTLAQVQSKSGELESGLEFVARVRGWLADLPPGKVIIAFSHFAVVRECLRQLRPEPAPQVIEHCAIFRTQLAGREP